MQPQNLLFNFSIGKVFMKATSRDHTFIEIENLTTLISLLIYCRDLQQFYFSFCQFFIKIQFFVKYGRESTNPSKLKVDEYS